MNLITQFNGFRAWASGINYDYNLRARSVYIAILEVFNSAGWPHELAISNSELIKLSRVCINDPSGFGDVRNELITSGLIKYKKQKGRKSPIYQLKDLEYLYKEKPNSIPNQIPKQTPNQDPNQIPNPYYSNKENKKEIYNNHNNSACEDISFGAGFGEMLTENEIAGDREREQAINDLYAFHQHCNPKMSSDRDRARIEKRLVDGYTKEQVHYAIDEASKGNGFNWFYIDKVLKDNGGGNGGTVRENRGSVQGQRQQSPAGHSNKDDGWGDLGITL